MEKVEIIARAIARRKILRALGIMRPESEWGMELTGLFSRSGLPTPNRKSTGR